MRRWTLYRRSLPFANATARSTCWLPPSLSIPKWWLPFHSYLINIRRFSTSSLQCLCAIKLTQCGMHLKKISYPTLPYPAIPCHTLPYPDIVYKALDSKRAKKFLEICLSIVHFQFTIAQLSFIIQGLKSTTESLFDI